MPELDWLSMLSYQQELHHFARTMLAQAQNQALTTSQRELLSRLFLEPQENTPLALSRRSGMKKEAVSRCLKQLHEKGYVKKEKHPKDERSYMLTLTEAGRKALETDYGALLQSFYTLRRRMGGEAFDTLFQLIIRANINADIPPFP